MKTIKPDYTNSIVNLSNSIMKYFGLTHKHTTIKQIDKLLESNEYKHIILMVNDGLGYENIQELLPEDSFLRRNLVGTLSSVFPPTTTAATTSLQSGLTPKEHGWIGWDIYLDEIDDTVTLFTNQSKTNKLQYDYHVAGKYVAYSNIYNRINDETKYRAYGISPHETTPYEFEKVNQMYDIIEDLCSKDENNYLYAYYNEPDNLMHRYGTQSDQVKAVVSKIDKNIEDLSRKLKDTLLIVTADHGHVDVKTLYIEDYPDIKELMSRELSIETRAANFFIKEGQESLFVERFNQHFSGKFKLMSKQEVIESNLFGTGVAHPQFERSLGDFLAVATDDTILMDDRIGFEFESHHAGMTEREMIVPLIVIDCK